MRALAILFGVLVAGCAAIKSPFEAGSWWAGKLTIYLVSITAVVAAVVRLKKWLKAKKAERKAAADEIAERTRVMALIRDAVLGDGAGSLGARLNAQNKEVEAQNKVLAKIEGQHTPEILAALALRVDGIDARVHFNSGRLAPRCDPDDNEAQT